MEMDLTIKSCVLLATKFEKHKIIYTSCADRLRLTRSSISPGPRRWIGMNHALRGAEEKVNQAAPGREMEGLRAKVLINNEGGSPEAIVLISRSEEEGRHPTERPGASKEPKPAGQLSDLCDG